MMEWNENLATNIDMIDTQHKEIIRRINDVLLAGNRVKEPAQLKLTLKLLADYCATHFSQEENLQLRSKYPKYKQHKQLHIDFLAKVKTFQTILDTTNDREGLAISIEREVADWLIHHINGVDKVLAKYLIEVNFLK